MTRSYFITGTDTDGWARPWWPHLLHAFAAQG